MMILARRAGADRPRLAQAVMISLILLGALVVVGASMYTTMLPGVGAPERDLVVATLLDDTAYVGQRFVAELPDLSGLRLWIDAPGAAGDALVTLRIVEPRLPELPLAEAILPLRDAGPDGSLLFRFRPLRAAQRVAPARAVELQLHSSGLPASAAMRVRGNANTYVDGTAMIDGAVANGLDLAFVPLYARRPFDAIWPISRMADGRPGLLGWPPFYSLLAYGFLVALARAAAQLWLRGWARN